MTIHSSIPGWEITQIEEAVGLQLTGFQRVGLSECTHTHTHTHTQAPSYGIPQMNFVALRKVTKRIILSSLWKPRSYKQKILIRIKLLIYTSAILL